MAKLIVFEGVDGVGKTTQAKILMEKLGAKMIRQPSSDNCVSTIRSEIKLNPAYSALERQLLAAISHTVDAFTEFSDENIIMDRSYISGLVYGKTMGVDNYGMALIENLLSSVYQTAIKHNYDTHIVFMDADKSLKTADENDVFETNWTQVRDAYREFYQTKHEPFFSRDEKIYQIQIETTIEATSNKLHDVLGL